MNDMRQLATLLLELRKIMTKDNVTGEDILDRKNFTSLQEAIENITSNEDGSLKASLKIALGFL